MEFRKIFVQTLIFFISESVPTSIQTEMERNTDLAETDEDSVGRSRDVDGFVLVPAYIDTSEMDFYETVYRNHDPVTQFLIEYDGIKMMKVRGQDVPFMRLRNVTENFDSPCVLKIRMMHNTWDPAVDTIEYNDFKEAFTFSILSYEYEDTFTQEFVTGSHVRKAGHVIETLFNFMNGTVGFQLGLVDKILEQLRLLSSWFEFQTKYEFHRNLILIAYDAEELTHSRDRNLKNVVVKMMDFSHVTRSNTRDENYLRCLTELIQTIDNLNTMERY